MPGNHVSYTILSCKEVFSKYQYKLKCGLVYFKKGNVNYLLFSKVLFTIFSVTKPTRFKNVNVIKLRTIHKTELV
jgi:hypothetical protein